MCVCVAFLISHLAPPGPHPHQDHQLISLWPGGGACPPSPAACSGLGRGELAGLTWGGHLVPHSVPQRRKAALPQSLLRPCSLPRADGAQNSLLPWPPISLMHVYTVIEEGRPMCTTLCHTASAWMVRGWVVHALGCTLASPGRGTLHRRTVHSSGGGEAKVSMRSLWRYAELGPESKV